MSLSMTRVTGKGGQDAFQVLNTPIIIRKNHDTSWTSYIPTSAVADFLIASSVRTKTEAIAAVERYIEGKLYP